jgi:hypothetical protein
MSLDHDEDTCDVVKAFRRWQEVISVQEEHTDTSTGLSFHYTQGLIGWDDHQRCILPVVENMAEEVMDAKTPAEAYLLIKSSLCQMALVCYILGRQREGAEV